MNEGEEPWELFYRRGAPLWRGGELEFPAPPDGRRVLDVGCGTGSALIKMAASGYECVGLDISPTALSTAARRLDERGLSAELVHGDITRLREGDMGRFDLILAHYVLGALERDGRVLAAYALSGMLESGGVLSFEDLARGDHREGKGEILEERTYRKGNGLIQHFFTEEEVRGLFPKLIVESIRTEEWKVGGMNRRRIHASYRSRRG